MLTCLGFLRMWCLGPKSELPKSTRWMCVTFVRPSFRSHTVSFLTYSVGQSGHKDLLGLKRMGHRLTPCWENGKVLRKVLRKQVWCELVLLLSEESRCHSLDLGSPHRLHRQDVIGYNWLASRVSWIGSHIDTSVTSHFTLTFISLLLFGGKIPGHCW